MRILHIISSKGVYGAEKVVLSLMRMLKENGFYSSLICLKNNGRPDPEIYNEAKKEGLNAKVLTCRGKMDFKAVKEIGNIARNESIDIIHSHGYKGDMYGFISSKLSKVPAIATLHGWTEESRVVRLYEYLDRMVVKRFNYAVAVSSSVAEELRKIGLKNGEASVIYNGIDPEEFVFSESRRSQYRKTIGINNEIVISVVGRLNPEKGHIYLLKAFKDISDSISNVRLLVVGEGELEEKLKEEARGLNIQDKVIFTGYEDDMVSVYSAMDIFVLPSVSEGLPLVLLEAMSMERPVVATKVGGIPSVVSDGEGILVPTKDSMALKEAIIRLIENEFLRKDMGKEAREKIVSQFSLESTFKKYLNVYTSLLNKNRSYATKMSVT